MSALGFVTLALVWSAVLWTAAKLLVKMGPSPKLAQAIWRGTAVLLALPFIAALLFSIIPDARSLPLPDMPLVEGTIGEIARSGVANKSTGPARPQPSLETFIGYLLVAGWALRLVVMGVGQTRLQHLKSMSQPIDISAGQWAHALNLNDVPQVKMISSGSPFVAGIRQREIYVPEALSGASEVDQVIAHECVHLARGDLIARPIERFVADLFWISPFAWFIRNELDYWREVVVDDVAANLTGDRFAYARALTHAARVARPEQAMPVAAFILPRQSTLKMRLNTLLNTSPYKSSRVGFAAAALAMLAVPIALAQGAGVQPDPGNNFTHAVLDKAKLSSGYGERQFKSNGKPTWHQGVDLAGEYGAPVYAPCDGEVADTDTSEGYGKLVTLYSGDDLKLRFAQLSKITVKKGQSVQAGDIIGNIGKSGVKATGPHLHLEVWKKMRLEDTGEMTMKPTDPAQVDGLMLAEVLVLPNGTKAEAPRMP